MNKLKALIVFSLPICFLSCSEKAYKNIAVNEGMLILSFDKNMEEYNLEDFKGTWTDKYFINDSLSVYGHSYSSFLITGLDTLFLDIFYLPATIPVDKIECPNENDFKEFNIRGTEIKIEMCEIEFPDVYTEYLHIWEGEIIHQKFKKRFLKKQFILTLTGNFRNGQMDEKTKRKLKDLFKSSDVIFQKE